MPDSRIATAFAPARSLEPSEAEVAAVLRRVQERSRARTRALRSGGLVSAVAGLAAVAVVLGAILLIGRSHAPTSRPASRNAIGARDLIARLAVLRRPQTAADRTLRLGPTLRGPGPGTSTIIPRLVRLVATLPGLKVFVVVTTPESPGLWSASLGDQVSLVTVARDQFGWRLAVPAADLHDPSNLVLAGPCLVGLVPDGVAKVRWALRDATGAPRFVTARVRDNVAVARVAGAPSPRAATWYDTRGRVVPTSLQRLQRAWEHRDQRARARAIEAAQRSDNRSAPVLLSRFRVFGSASRSGLPPIPAEVGLEVWHPGIASLPVSLLAGYPGGVDLREVRLVSTAAGLRFWIIPGARTACLLQIAPSPAASLLDPEPIPRSRGQCAPGLAPVEQAGLWQRSRGLIFGFVPDTNRTITLVMTDGNTHPVPVINGVFVAPARGVAKIQVRGVSGRLTTRP